MPVESPRAVQRNTRGGFDIQPALYLPEEDKSVPLTVVVAVAGTLFCGFAWGFAAVVVRALYQIIGA